MPQHGGKLWILGFKTEKTGTLIETTAGGITEVNGVFLYSNSGWNAGEPPSPSPTPPSISSE